MKKITFWKSFFLLFALIVGSTSAWADDYEKYSGTITEGDYLIVYSNGAMKASISNNRLEYTTVSPSNNIVSNPAANLIWHIAADGNYYTIYNANQNNYAASTGSDNKAKLESSITDNSRWTVSGTSTYEFVNKANSGNKNLRRNGTYGFACYSTSTGGALTLYKKKAANATALEVKTAPTKVNYKVGEKLDLTGLVLDATVGGNHVDVTSGYTATIGGTAVTSGTTALNTVGAQTITFTYGGQTCNQVIHVGALQNIALTTTGVKTEYNAGQTFDPTNLVVKANFSDEEETATEWEETLAAENYTITPSGALTTSDNNITISYTWGEVEKTADIDITVSAATAYTVTFNAGTGSCATASLTEATGLAGVTLPAATIGVTGWSFAGWATASTTNTEVAPTLYAAESTYHPVDNVTLYAVYKFVDGTEGEYKRATTVAEVTSAKSIAAVNTNASKTLTYDITDLASLTDVEGIVTPSTKAVITLTGNNTDGFTLSGNNNTLGATTLPSTNGNSTDISLTSSNNKWTVEKSTCSTSGYTNHFVFKNTNGTNVALEYTNNKWVAYKSSSYQSLQYYAFKVYIPAWTTVYNSNPAAIINPTVEFEKAGNKNLYLKGEKTYTNAANVTGIDKAPTYSLSNTDVAYITSDGIVTAKAVGTTTVTATVAAEPGVNTKATVSYELTVKDASSIAELKTIDNNSGYDFEADLTDAVVTYVKDNHAYIQDASAAIYVTFANHGLVAGQKINGAINGTVKTSYSIDQIIDLDLSDATVTADGVIPDALVKTTAQIRSAGTELDAQRVTVTGATASGTLETDAYTNNVTIKDASTSTVIIYAPNKGIEVNDKEEGSFTGFVSVYNGNSYRLNIYDQSQIVLTKNAPTPQTLAFAEDEVVLDEETEAYDAFVGQTVSGNKGTVSYAITSDENSIISTLNTETGAVQLSNGHYGTATITATAAAANITEAGVTTPYTETSKSYTVTTYPRYTSTFSVNGVETIVRQATHGAEITVPTPGNVGDYYFMGWKETSAIDTPTDVAPEMVTPPTTPTGNVTYYAVYAQERTGGEEDVISTLSLNQTEPTGSTSEVNDVTWSWNSVTFGSSGSSGMKASENASVTITLPSTALYAKSISLICPNQDWGSGATVVLKAGNSELASLGKSGSYTFTNSDNTAGTYTLSQTTSKNAWINTFALTYTVLGKENYDYRTSLPVVDVTVTATGYLSYCSPYKLDFSETNVKAYTAKVEDNKVVLTKVDVVPAETGIVLYSSEVANAAEPEATTYTIPVTDKDASDVTGNQMVGVLERTQVVWNPSTGVYNYILQQGEFRKATDGYLKPNRAYLSTSYAVPSNAKALTVVFADTATGINTLDNLTNSPFDNDAPMYNLAGQKVGKSYKGIVIQNGKKILKK